MDGRPSECWVLVSGGGDSTAAALWAEEDPGFAGVVIPVLFQPTIHAGGVMHDRSYIERTISTVRNHKDADNCWPQWANIFADEIERLWAENERLTMGLDAATQQRDVLLEELADVH